MRLIIVRFASPEPSPTATVTEILTAPPNPPSTIYVRVSDDWDMTQDMWLSDFGGALLGAIVAVLVALLVIRSDRQARSEERRTALAIEFMNQVDAALVALDADDPVAGAGDAGRHVSLWGARMAAIYGNSRRHRRYAEWIHYRTITVTNAIVRLRLAKSSIDKDAAIDEIVTVLSSMQGGTANWTMLSPHDWHSGDDSDVSIPRKGWGRLRNLLRKRAKGAPTDRGRSEGKS